MSGAEVGPVDPTDTIEHVVQLMAEHDCTHLVVVSPESQLPVGVVSSLDIAGALARG